MTIELTKDNALIAISCLVIMATIIGYLPALLKILGQIRISVLLKNTMLFSSNMALWYLVVHYKYIDFNVPPTGLPAVYFIFMLIINLVSLVVICKSLAEEAVK